MDLHAIIHRSAWKKCSAGFGSLGADDSAYYPTGDNQHPIAEKTRPAPGSEEGQHSVDPAGGKASLLLNGSFRFDQLRGC